MKYKNLSIQHRMTRLYKVYRQKVFSHCLHYTKDINTASDLCQDIFVKIQRNLIKFNRTSKYSTWMYTITKNHCLDYVRNTQRRTKLLEQPKNYSYQLNQTEQETFNRAIVYKEFAKHPKLLQRILYYRYVHGMTQSAIASKLKISRISVTKRLQNYHRKKLNN